VPGHQVLLSMARPATHARETPPDEPHLTGAPKARAPFAPAPAGGVSTGTKGWAQDGALTRMRRPGAAKVIGGSATARSDL
jgi:hypothetical protein